MVFLVVGIVVHVAGIALLSRHADASKSSNNVGSLLRGGVNILAVRAENRPAPTKNPAGLIARLIVTGADGRRAVVVSGSGISRRPAIPSAVVCASAASCSTMSCRKVLSGNFPSKGFASVTSRARPSILLMSSRDVSRSKKNSDR